MPNQVQAKIKLCGVCSSELVEAQSRKSHAYYALKEDVIISMCKGSESDQLSGERGLVMVTFHFHSELVFKVDRVQASS